MQRLCKAEEQKGQFGLAADLVSLGGAEENPVIRNAQAPEQTLEEPAHRVVPLIRREPRHMRQQPLFLRLGGQNFLDQHAGGGLGFRRGVHRRMTSTNAPSGCPGTAQSFTRPRPMSLSKGLSSLMIAPTWSAERSYAEFVTLT